MVEHTQEKNIRVLVVDDQRLMRDGITSLLSIQPGIEIAGTATNGREAIEQTQKLQPDVILMDVRMPVMDGVAATSEICSQYPLCQVLMLTTFDDDAYIIDALRAGARGYLLKDIPAQDLAKAIYALHRGIYLLDAAVASKVVALFTQPQPSSLTPMPLVSVLTEREIEVLRLVAQGATNREIATKLIISEGTVKNHISNILSHLGLRDRTQAAIYAKQQGLV